MRKIITILIIVLAIVSSPVLAAGEGPGPTGPECHTCPKGQVKYEVDDGEYEYTDGSAWIEVDSSAMTARWGPNEGFTVEEVCIKIGGPGGGSLIRPDPGNGEWTSTTYAISHVVLYTEAQPTAVELLGFAAGTRLLPIELSLLLSLALIVVLLLWARHERRRRR